jgi:hypothetical protein
MKGKKNTLIAICVGFIVLTIKGFWGMANPPFYNNEGAQGLLLCNLHCLGNTSDHRSCSQHKQPERHCSPEEQVLL